MWNNKELLGEVAICFTPGPYLLALVEFTIKIRDLGLQLSDGPRLA